jgi:Protein of unknown function (DUF4236)
MSAMPWYIRKALTHGPIRLNLSKSGLGASVGVTGLRIGIGPKGTYVHGGRHGLYYRKCLNGPKGQYREQSPALSPPTALGEPVEQVAVPAADDEVAAEINSRLNAFRPSVAVFWLGLLIGVALVANHILILAVIVTAALLITTYFLSRREANERRIEFSYDLQGNVVKRYGSCVEAFRAAAQCAAIWRIVTQTASRDIKYTAGAGSTVERSLTRITFDDPIIQANIQTIWLWVAGGKLCLLPGRMLFFGQRGVSSLDYGDVRVEAMSMDFREGGTVPPDSTNVGTTWQYVNKTGGPDRRFFNNRRLPIQRYSDFIFTHPRLSFRLEFSRFGIADAIAKAMRSIAVTYPTSNPGVTTEAQQPTMANPRPPSDIVAAKAAVGNVEAVIANLAASGKRTPIVFHLSATGDSEKIKAWLNSFSDEIQRLLLTSAPLFDEARHATPLDGAPMLEPAQAFERCRAALSELSVALLTVTHFSDAHAIAEGLNQFLQTAARIESEFNEARTPATFAPTKVQFAAMLDEMLSDLNKWPDQVREQATALGTTTSCKVDLAFTSDTATLIVGLTQAGAALLAQTVASSGMPKGQTHD